MNSTLSLINGIVTVLASLWFAYTITWLRKITSDAAEKSTYFSKQLIVQLRELNLIRAANVIQASKITDHWTVWIEEMVEFRRTLLWFLIAVVLQSMVHLYIGYTSWWQIGIIVVLTILSAFSCFVVRAQHFIIDRCGYTVNTVIESVKLRNEHGHLMTQYQKQQLDALIDAISNEAYWTLPSKQEPARE